MFSLDSFRKAEGADQKDLFPETLKKSESPPWFLIIGVMAVVILAMWIGSIRG